MNHRTKKILAATLSAFSVVFMAAMGATALGYGDTVTTWVNKVVPAKYSITSTTAATSIESNQAVLTNVTEYNDSAKSAEKQPAYISMPKAIEIANTTFPRNPVKGTPELVDYNGVVAYELLMQHGKVYVDASKGSILNPIKSSSTASNQQNTPVQRDAKIVESRAEKSNRMEDKLNDEVRGSTESAYSKGAFARDDDHKEHGKHRDHEKHREHEEEHDG